MAGVGLSSMGIFVRVPHVSGLDDIVETLASWQRDSTLVQLHPGDLGWAWRHGASAVAGALRVWSDDDVVVAIGFLDGPTVFRMTVAPDRWVDEHAALRVLEDLSAADHALFGNGVLSVEIPVTTKVHEVLASAGWRAGEAWTPLARDLARAVDVRGTGLNTEEVDSGTIAEFTAVHRAAWGNESFTDDRWNVMAAGSPFRDGICLLGRDATGAAVAGVTIWSAGVGRPGLLEPMGVSADHRGRGYGRAICVAAAAALRQRGASIAWVCTPSSLPSAVATYRSAGFISLPERLDRIRPD